MILFGTNPIAWSNDDDQSLGAEISLQQCLEEAASIGFDGIEKGHKMPSNPKELKRELQPHGLKFISGWHSTNMLVRSLDTEKQAIQPHLDLLKSMGCKVCIVCETSNAIHGDDNKSINESPVLVPERWEEFASNIEAIAQYCKDQGVQLVYHHHMGTVVETEEEINELMSRTGPATKLLLDTGHAHFAGIDPSLLAKRYMDRIAHLHLKNVRPEILDEVRKDGLSFLEGVRRGVFTVPGDIEGCIDFEPVLRKAAEKEYNGWLVIEAEQDPQQRNPFEYQSMGLAALREIAARVGLHDASLKKESV